MCGRGSKTHPLFSRKGKCVHSVDVIKHHIVLHVGTASGGYLECLSGNGRCEMRYNYTIGNSIKIMCVIIAVLE